MSEEFNAAEAVSEVTQKGTFNFAKAVLDRGYPEIKVPIHLDEAKTRRLVEYAMEISELEDDLARSAGDAALKLTDKLDAVVAARDALAEELKAEAVTVVVQGMDPGDIEDIYDEARERFPIEYTQYVNPLTGKPEREEIPSPERADYIDARLRHAHIVRIIGPDGSEAPALDFDELNAIWRKLPVVARAKINKAITDSTVTVDYYREIVDEVF